MKLVELERWLRLHGCEPQTGSGRGGHTRWLNNETGEKAFVPRHRELPVGLARKICRQLGIPPIQKR